ncbi:hypothetical protein DOA20_21080 [Salmonella enterica subsp. enterica serovar Newport]|nr:hypothetical protein [Salmonella enterica subsp. enterica serovar Newport]
MVTESITICDQSVVRTTGHRPAFVCIPEYVIGVGCKSVIDLMRIFSEIYSEIYNERREIKQGFGELKSQQLKNEVTLRSCFPEGVRQEIWGILIACNLVRKDTSFIAEETKVLPVMI